MPPPERYPSQRLGNRPIAGHRHFLRRSDCRVWHIPTTVRRHRGNNGSRIVRRLPLDSEHHRSRPLPLARPGLTVTYSGTCTGIRSGLNRPQLRLAGRIQSVGNVLSMRRWSESARRPDLPTVNTKHTLTSSAPTMARRRLKDGQTQC